jgi:nucleoside-diphosphate-sugar epimerase
LIDAYIGVLKASIERRDIFGEIYNLGTGEMSIKKLAETVAKLSQEKFSRTPEIKFESGRQEIESKSLILSTEKAKNILGFNPKYTIREGLERTLEYIMKSQQI